MFSPRTLGSTDKSGRRAFVCEETWTRLMEAKDRYEDLATWRMMSPSAEDTEVMLDILATAHAGGFQWNSCPPPTLYAYERPKSLNPQRALDSPETMTLIDIPPLDSESESTSTILNESLKRGGSSLESVHDLITTRARTVVDTDDTDDTESFRAPREADDSPGMGSSEVSRFPGCHYVI